MTNEEMAKLFFPGSRRGYEVIDISLLQTAKGEKRIKMELSTSFADGKTVSMPSYLGEPFERLAKQDSVERFSKLDLEFEAMSLFIFTTEDHQKAAQTLYNVYCSSFTMVREKQKEGTDEVPDVSLKFVATAPSNPSFWTWIYPYHRNHFFVRFEPTQSDLSDKPKDKPADQMKLGDDDHEAARKDATSKAHDAEFARA
jgi:hypothetical protein